MKIVKLYRREINPDEVNNFRVYRRKVRGSKICGFAICRDDSHYNYVVEKQWDAYKSIGLDNLHKQLSKFREDKLVVLSLDKWVMDRHSNLDSKIETIIEYISKNHDSHDRMYDIIRAWVNRVDLAFMVDCINNPNLLLETYDDLLTIFHKVAESNTYSNGDDIEGEIVSEQCIRWANYCEHCDYKEIDEDANGTCYIETEDISVCDDCYGEYYSSCDGCDEINHTDNMYWSDRRDTYFCEGCQPTENEYINEYDYTPPINFYDYKSDKIVDIADHTKHNVPFYGAELEVECYGGSKNDIADEISHYGGYHEKFCYCKRDGSLEDGFEICFMPMTFQAIRHFDFHDAVLRFRGRERLQSYNTGTCGIHIHINREAFSDHHLFKFITFIHEFKSFVYLISQRKKVGELNSYAKFNNGYKDRAKHKMATDIKHKKDAMKRNMQRIDEDKSKVSKHSTSIYGDKYVPVNLQHTHTIEVRIFKGNLREVSFRKNFEFIDSLYYYTKNNPIYKLRLKEFINYCTSEKKRYPNLNNFLADNSIRLEKILTFPLEVPEGLQF